MIWIGINKQNLHVLVAKLVLLLLLLISAPLALSANEPDWPKPPFSVEQLRAWHKSVEPWP